MRRDVDRESERAASVRWKHAKPRRTTGIEDGQQQGEHDDDDDDDDDDERAEEKFTPQVARTHLGPQRQ